MTPYAVSILAKLPADYGKAAPVGLFIVLALGIVVVFLVRSMNKHVKRVPRAFGADGGPGATPATAGQADSNEQAKISSDVTVSPASPTEPTTPGENEAGRDERAARRSAPTDPA